MAQIGYPIRNDIVSFPKEILWHIWYIYIFDIVRCVIYNLTLYNSFIIREFLCSDENLQHRINDCIPSDDEMRDSKAISKAVFRTYHPTPSNMWQSLR